MKSKTYSNQEKSLALLQDIDTLDCRSEEGITVGLIDTIITVGRVYSKRDLTSNRHAREALKDLFGDADMRLILSAAEIDTSRGLVGDF